MALAHITRPPAPTPDLYESDYTRWLFENARLPREGRFSEADIAHIAEELEDTGLCNAANETGLPESSFPEAIPYSLEQVLDMAFRPGADA